ncbi:MAG: hypothetical protein RR340_01760 [Cloacibacillus sp.]
MRIKTAAITLLLFIFCLFGASAEAGAIPVKVMVLTFYDMKDVARVPLKYSLEIKRWYDKNFSDAEYYRIRKTNSYVYIKDGLAFMSVEAGKSKTVSSLSALLKDARFDFCETYFIVTGEARVSPKTASTGSVCVADWALDSDYRAVTSKNGKRTVTAVKAGSLFKLNDQLVRWSIRLNEKTKFTDHPKAAKYRKQYKTPTAQLHPFIYRAATVTSFSGGQGEIFSQTAEKLCRNEKAGRYGALQSEDNAIAYVLKKSRHIDRLAVIRAVTNYDSAPQGGTKESSGAFAIGVINNYRAAAPLVSEIVGNWERWKKGVPSI